MPEAENKQTGDNQQNDQQPESETFEVWLDKQDEAVKGLYETHVTGLRNSVRATRQERDDLAKQIKDLLPKAEKGSELEKSLTELNTRLDATEKRAAFYEEAGKPEIGCRNPKAAFLLAQADGLYDRRGNPDWRAIKEAAPELFGRPGTPGNAGTGTAENPPKAGMNEYIRRSAGR